MSNKIGPHRSELPNDDCHPIVQTNVGPMQSLTIPRTLVQRPVLSYQYEVVWHAAFIAAIAPKIESVPQHAEYLNTIIRIAGIHKISKIVVHTGATVGRQVDQIKSTIDLMLGEYGIRESLVRANVTLCIEVAANISVFNCNPQFIGEWTKDEPNVGWCLDLAHVYGTGVQWQRLANIVEKFPPSLCHVNFPGTYFASSCDVHGWRHRPTLYKQGRKMLTRSDDETKLLCVEWDSMVIFLKQRGISMIVEGSGFEGSPIEELAFIKDLK